VYQYAASRFSKHWADPHSYRPERIEKEGEFAQDQLDASNPFSIGPRNCVGMK
jgi:averantin hydroxylase